MDLFPSDFIFSERVKIEISFFFLCSISIVLSVKHFSRHKVFLPLVERVLSLPFGLCLFFMKFVKSAFTSENENGWNVSMTQCETIAPGKLSAKINSFRGFWSQKSYLLISMKKNIHRGFTSCPQLCNMSLGLQVSQKHKTCFHFCSTKNPTA